MNFKKKIIFLSIASAAAVAVLSILLMFFQHEALNQVIHEEIDALTRANIYQISRDVQGMVKAMDEAVQTRVNHSLNVAADILKRTGGITQTAEKVQWQAVNQYTKRAQNVLLPRVKLGKTAIRKNNDLSIRTPLVDDIADLVGGTATLFQRMNEAGDMLRIATNVKKLDGKRAIETFIPAINPDGAPNPVIHTVLQGRTYRGRAYVVNKWYLTAYEPILDDSGKIIGILYVGVPQEDVKSLRQAIMDITVGKSGYVWVLGGTGSIQGEYIISKDGERDGENIWEATDADGNLFIQKMINTAIGLGPEDVVFHAYPWKNMDEDNPRFKIAALTYYEPWDWVIGAGAYEDDFFEIKGRTNTAFEKSLITLVSTLTMIMILFFSIAYVMGQRLLKPLDYVVANLKDIAQGEGDLTVRIPAMGRDEISELATGFNTFVEKIGDVITPLKSRSDELKDISALIAGESDELAAGAREQLTQLSEISTTIEETSAMLLESSAQTEATKQSAGEADRLAAQGIKIMDKTMTGSKQIEEAIITAAKQIRGLQERSAGIGTVVTVIDDIADQTNLLALNANIEAARAGESGRGFAVVADEVRKLAERTIQATDQIDREISSMQEDVLKAVAAISQIQEESAQNNRLTLEASEAIKGITEAINGVNMAMLEIAMAAEQQSTGIEEVSHNISGVSSVSQQASDQAQALAKAGESLAVSVNEIKAMINQFKVV